MIKRLIAVMLCCVMVLLCGCSRLGKFKRISFDAEILSGDLKCITDDTIVTYSANESFPSKLPIYYITERTISENDVQKMKENLGITKYHRSILEGNELIFRLVPYGDDGRSVYETFTEADLERMAWESLSKIPFANGEYTYAGVTGSTERSQGGSVYKTIEVPVSFYRCIGDISVVGNEKLNLTFDATGLVEVYAVMFDYTQIGMMDVVPLEEAKNKIKTPDWSSLNETSGKVKTLETDRVQMYLINQHSKGCQILQPIYTFYGTAKTEAGGQTSFKSRVIAIPETMTYEE